MVSTVTVKGKPVIEIYESFEGSYWYITEKCFKQDSIIKGKVYKNDQILFGYVKLSACPQFAEFGYISETELRLLSPIVWKVSRINWEFCPDIEVKQSKEQDKDSDRGINPCQRGNIKKSYVIKCKEVANKMDQTMLKKIDEYLELVEEIKAKTDSDIIAVAIFQQLCKDRGLNQNRNNRIIDGDMPATEKQIAYLRRLGSAIPENLTKQKASELIDKAQQVSDGIKAALKHPIKISV